MIQTVNDTLFVSKNAGLIRIYIQLTAIELRI